MARDYHKILGNIIRNNRKQVGALQQRLVPSGSFSWTRLRRVSTPIKLREQRIGQPERRCEREKESELDCVLLGLYEMSQVETSFRRQPWHRLSTSQNGKGFQSNIQADIYSYLFFTPTNTQTHVVSRVFRYTLAGKQFHKLTYKVEKRSTQTRETNFAGRLPTWVDSLIVSIISRVTKIP